MLLYDATETVFYLLLGWGLLRCLAWWWFKKLTVINLSNFEFLFVPVSSLYISFENVLISSRVFNIKFQTSNIYLAHMFTSLLFNNIFNLYSVFMIFPFSVCILFIWAFFSLTKKQHLGLWNYMYIHVNYISIHHSVRFIGDHKYLLKE